MAEWIKKHPALSLLLLSTGLAIAPIMLVSTGVLPPGFSQLGALSASAAGFILAAIEGRKGGVRELLSRALIWKVGIGWWLFALFFTAIISVLTFVIFNALSANDVALAGSGPWYDIFPMIIFLTIFAGFGEEFGWRGYLIPRLQARHSALITSLIIGLVHTLWHVPMFFSEGQSQYAWVQAVGFPAAFLGYFLFVTAWSVQMTWVFNNTRGSVLLAAVIHGAGNSWIGGYIDIFAGTGMTGNYILTGLMVAASVLIVLYAGPANYSRSRERQKLE